MKRMLKAIVVSILAWQVRRLYKKKKFTTIAVAGSYGKTSTKLAIVQVLQTKFRVRYQDGNYNDITTVPLIFFGHDAPSLFNPLSWTYIFLKNELALLREYEFDLVVVELGIDGPGQMREFKKYLQADYAVITSIAPEHMESFDGVEAVAREEFDLVKFSKKTFVNANLCLGKLFEETNAQVTPFSINFNSKDLSQPWEVRIGRSESIRLEIQPSSLTQLYTWANAAVVGTRLGLPSDEIKRALLKIKPVPGRMNLLRGKNGSQIIDDTYNASPDATIIALDTLYEKPAKKRIALLGNMNELGTGSEDYHRAVGKHCDPAKLDLVVTLGPEANAFLAEAAKKNGCTVLRTATPAEAAKAIEGQLGKDVVVLAKGSQNGVFAEETVKQLLADPQDSGLLVRQSPAWTKKKQKSFQSAK